MTMRLGELLVQDGACSAEVVRQALQHQAIFGGRLGTNLLEIGAIAEEVLARALGRLTGAPSLCGELSPAPRALRLLERRLAERWDVVPYLLADRKLALLTRDPRDLEMLDEVAFATGKSVQAFVVPEARVWETLWRAYGIDREHRGLAPPSRKAPAVAAAAPARVAEAGPADLIDEAGFQELYGALAAGPSRPGGPPAVAAAPDPADGLDELEPLAEEGEGATGSSGPPLTLELQEAIATAPAHPPPPQLGFPPAPPPALPVPWVEPTSLSFDEAIRFLEGVRDRATIALTVLRYARSRFARAVLLTIKGQEARGWEGLGEGVSGEAVRRIQLPLDQPGAVETVVSTRGPTVGPLARTAANIRLLKGLGGGVPRNAVLLPVLALGRVVNVLYADAGPGRAVEAPDLGELLILSARMARSYDHLAASAV
jgi:hypothetical protein